ncbi:conjugative transfer protein MobI(A/C) [Oceanimonas smirnovii]|uniref:conjugative transfer protein MobI(A/C) n=1 Tax=Oceanimonas smirnovii TaxID=264574 RepID=UPI00376FA9D5
MHRTKDEWESLLLSKDPEDRFDITKDELQEDSADFVRSLQSLIERERMLAAVTAKICSDKYWQANLAAREEGSTEEPCYYGTRVRFKDNSFYAEWFYNTTRPEISHSMPKKTFSKHIRKGRGYRYHRSSFNKAPSWIKPIIEDVEDNYALVRQRIEKLKIIQRELRDYERLLEETYRDDE